MSLNKQDVLMPDYQSPKQHLPTSLFCTTSETAVYDITVFSHTVFSSDYGELVPNTFLSKRVSISSSERAVVVFGLFPRLCFFQFFLL